MPWFGEPGLWHLISMLCPEYETSTKGEMSWELGHHLRTALPLRTHVGLNESPEVFILLGEKIPHFVLCLSSIYNC